jgi:hypothetical protein
LGVAAMAMKNNAAFADGAFAPESGQGTLEYILLLAVIVTGFSFVMSQLDNMDLASKLAGPINGPFAKTYRYGYAKAKGWDDGGPVYHPRATDKGNNNFRIFINPGKV